MEKEKEVRGKTAVEITADILPHATVRVPRQAAGSVDCGVFVLHFIELFLARPWNLDQKSLESQEEWFPPSDIPQKRTDIRNIIFSQSSKAKIK